MKLKRREGKKEYRISYVYNFNGIECKGIYYTSDVKSENISRIKEELERRNRTVISTETVNA